MPPNQAGVGVSPLDPFGVTGARSEPLGLPISAEEVRREVVAGPGLLLAFEAGMEAGVEAGGGDRLRRIRAHSSQYGSCSSCACPQKAQLQAKEHVGGSGSKPTLHATPEGAILSTAGFTGWC